MNHTTPGQPIGLDDGKYLGASVKKCTKCGETKPLEAFCVDRATRTGRKPRCRGCVSADKKDWARRNPDKRREWHLRWARQNPEKRKAGEVRFRENHKEQLRLQAQEYRKANPDEAVEYRKRNADKIRERNRIWRANNPDKVKASQEARALRFTALDRKRAADATREWSKANPGKSAMQRYAFRARKEVNLAKFREEDLADIGEIYAEAMRLSEETGQRMVCDHIFPLKGKTVSGLHVAANIRVVTNSVNSRKSKFLPGCLAELLWDPNGEDVYYDGDPPRKKRNYRKKKEAQNA